jgi:hypothetical protein
MKAFYRILLLGGVFILIILPLNASGLKAQKNTGPIFGSTTEVKLINQGQDKKPNKLILVYDSTNLVFEFTENGELAFISAIPNLDLPSVRSDKGNLAVTTSVLTENQINKLMNNVLSEQVDEEEELEIKDWMIHPETWLKQQ